MPRSVRTTRLRPKSFEAQKHHHDVFLPKIAEMRKKVEAISLTVLVWGPGKGHDLYPVRVGIINDLRAANFNAETSENVVTEVGVWSVRSQELLQAMAADLIVILCSSPGSIAEMSDFSNQKEIAQKMLVFLDGRHKKGYVGSGPARDLSVFGHVHWYKDPDDVDSGKIALMVLHHAQQYQLATYLRSRLG
jgi:hypothetical protein